MKKLTLFAILLTFSVNLWSQKISELPAASTVHEKDVTVIVQSGVTRKISMETLLDYLIANYPGDSLLANSVGIHGDTLIIGTDTLIMAGVEELNDLSDVNLTNQDAWDMLRLDDESMQWINVPLHTFIDTLHDNGIITAHDSTWHVTADNGVVEVKPYAAKKESDPGYAYFYDDSISFKNGYLYNSYAVINADSISNIGWHVPTYTELNTLLATVGSYPNVRKLKQTGTVYWTSNNGTNTYKFNAKGSGIRNWNDGGFYNIKEMHRFWSSTNASGGKYWDASIQDNNTFTIQSDWMKYGYSIRLIKNTTSLNHGETGTYVGNDGKIYKTICIGAQEWLAENLCETQYRSGTEIPEEVSNTSWKNLSTGARCAYNNSSDSAYLGHYENPTYTNVLKLDGILDATGIRSEGDIIAPNLSEAKAAKQLYINNNGLITKGDTAAAGGDSNWTLTGDTIYNNDSTVVKLNNWLMTDYITNQSAGSNYNTILGEEAFLKDSRIGDSANSCTFIGYHTGYDADSLLSSTIIGTYTGVQCKNIYNGAFYGSEAGNYSTNVYQGLFLGHASGNGSDSISYTNFIGSYCGQETNVINYSTFLGWDVGYEARNINKSIFIGRENGKYTENISNTIFIGDSVGYGASNISHQIWIDDSNTSSPLIEGHFDTDSLIINGSTTITDFLLLPPQANPPSPAREGMIYADTDHHLYYYNGSTWKQLDN